VEAFMHGLEKRNPGESEFHQAVREVTESLMPYILEHPKYKQAQILERLTEPDRIIIFRVTWVDDDGNFRANRAWRVQFNNSIGPYKGGLRFHPDVTQSVLKFLGLEQSQNALRLSWSHDEVDAKLQTIMKDIHQKCVTHGTQGDRVDYIDGANLAGFTKIAEAMLAYGAV
jgi:glutamate dehydrogenase/leucine dehydrogenase